MVGGGGGQASPDPRGVPYSSDSVPRYVACVVVLLLACLLVIGPRRRAVMHPKPRFPHIQEWYSLGERQRVGKIAG